MSDLMTNAEVEDVLSSIRRLVSEEERGTSTKSNGATGPSVDRLVLTPAQRIVPANDLPEPDADSGSDDTSTVLVLQGSNLECADNSAPVSDNETSDLEYRDSENETVPENFEFNENTDELAADENDDVSLEDDAVDSVFMEEDASEDVDWNDAAPEASDLANGASVFDGIEDVDAFDDTALTASDVDTPEETNRSLGEKVATLEALIASRGDQWEPDDTGQSDYAARDYPASEWSESVADQADESPEDRGLSLEDDSQMADGSEDLAQAVGDMLTVQASDEPLEKLEISTKAEPMKLDAWSVEDEAPFEHVETSEDTSNIVDNAMDTAVAATSAAVLGAVSEDQRFLSADDDVIDEAALREMIADIVREELQGALGERITRNVRKLVRREIHRALAAQDLD